jgi:hypothetical protein
MTNNFPILTPKSILNNIKRGILDSLKEKLNELEITIDYFDFHEVINPVLDRNTPYDPKLCHEIMVAFMTNEDYENIDEGLIDKSSPKRILITSAYVALENELFKDCFFADYLQNNLDSEISHKKAHDIIENIDDYIHKNYLKPQFFQDNEVQVFVIIGHKLEVSDFQEPYFNKSQVIDLCDGIEILANNHEVNKNAIVIERLMETKKGYHYRVYIMDKSKNLDMRKLLIRYGIKDTIGSHNGWNLDPRHYIDSPRTDFPDKETFIYTINKLVNGDEGLIVLGEKEHENKI